MSDQTPNQPSVTPMQYAGSGAVVLILARAFSSGDWRVQVAGIAAAAVVTVGLAWHERSLRGARLQHDSQIKFNETQLELHVPYVEHQRPTPPDHDPFTVDAPRGVTDDDHPEDEARPVPVDGEDPGGGTAVVGDGAADAPGAGEGATAPGVPTAEQLEAARPSFPFPTPLADI